MLSITLLALCPVALLIGFGLYLRSTNFVDETFWTGAEKMAYFILLPSLFFVSLATANLGEISVVNFALAIFLATCTGAVILWILRYFFNFGGDGATFTSLFQGAIRFNNYVGLTVAASIFGDIGIVLAAVANAILVPTVNILCILVFAQYGKMKPTFLSILRQILINPLVLACVLGSFVKFIDFQVPDILTATLFSLGKAALPLGLLCVGAALKLDAINGELKRIVLASIAKFIILPFSYIVIMVLLNVTGPAITVGLLFMTLPTASSSYILARQLGGNAPLMAGIISLQTVAGMAIVPLVLSYGSKLANVQ